MTVRTAPRITGNGFLVDGYAIETFLVARVDNDGEPCEVCQTEGHVIDCAVYGVVLDEHACLYVAVECCAVCVPAVVATMDPTADVTVELSLAAWGDSTDDTEDNGLMASQDDDRPHPDAL